MDGWRYMVLMNQSTKSELDISLLGDMALPQVEWSYSSLREWSFVIYRFKRSLMDNISPWEYDINGLSWKISRAPSCKTWMPRLVESPPAVSSSASSTLAVIKSDFKAALVKDSAEQLIPDWKRPAQQIVTPHQADLDRVNYRLDSMELAIKRMETALDNRVAEKLNPVRQEISDVSKALIDMKMSLDVVVQHLRSINGPPTDPSNNSNNVR